MDIFETSQNLIDQELNMIIRQFLGADNIIQIGTHEMSNQIPVINVPK